MDIYLFLFVIHIFIIGSCFGSFFDLCIDRVQNQKSILKPRSHCTNCMTKLSLNELIPIFSFIFLKGRCRHCNIKLSIMYLLSEVLWGFLFLIVFYNYGISLKSIFIIFIEASFFIIGLIKYNSIDNKLININILSFVIIFTFLILRLMTGGELFDFL